VVKNTENVISLYSGGGGLDIGFRLAIPNARTVCYVEREISSVSVLVNGIEKGILDDAPIWTNSTTFDGSPWIGKVDWIIGGFPCQPWSVAGKREGKEDERWLWDDIKQIAMSVQPTGFFLENVSGLITGHGIDTILGDLSEMGFDAEWGSVKAGDIGAPHRRERVFILAARRGTDCRFNDILGNTESYGHEHSKGTDRREECESLNGNKVRNISSSTDNSELDDTEHERHEKRMQSKTISSRCRQNDEKLDDTEHNGCNAAEEQGSDGQTVSGSEKRENSAIESKGTDNTRVTLENSSSERLQGIGAESQDRGNIGLSNRTQVTRSELGIFPPAPNSEEWESILREHPRLSPALEKSSFEPDVRGMVNGMAPGLHRADRLRILGNGVVPIQAAYALTVLARRFQT
jgi:DNA (cytosine-5)-methyltransferase 1